VSQVRGRIRRCSPLTFYLCLASPVFLGASVLWIPVANNDQPRHFDAEVLFYETDLVLDGNPEVIRQQVRLGGQLGCYHQVYGRCRLIIEIEMRTAASA
jgi:hypothetical protein